ncbi:hypothetical protein [Polyangium aurulentum]|uniref:hypothetical protein n=1 Tax=Polyangium aurulentum TaxID=2567896 RepID=UPI0010AE7C12|nr:hypothetical protein [Polyangium aurulentum]UQA57214.1 hypothetical protein E8A73_038900 [Polyangium aurulentum]
MTRRRRTYLAIAVLAGVLVTAGLGAHRGDRDDAREDPCSDLEDLSEFCAAECGGVAEAFADACHAACMMGVCPKELGYTKQDPIWSAPCTDMAGARFWDEIDGAEVRCEYKFHWFQDQKFDPATFYECWRAEAEQRCPEFIGTDWWPRFQVARGR